MNQDQRGDTAPSVDRILRHDWERERDVGILVDLLRRSSTPEQFIYREVELDELWRWLDDELRAERDGERLAALRGMKEHVMRAHDLSAEGEVALAADDLVAGWSRHGDRLRGRRPDEGREGG